WVTGKDDVAGDVIQVFAGNGDGTFSTTPIATTRTPLDWAGTDAAQSTFLADVTGDGVADWVTGRDDVAGDPILVFEGNGDGTFDTNPITTDGLPGDWAGTSGYQSTFLEDVNGDGNLDWVGCMDGCKEGPVVF